ncbi:MAG: hypothetical protein FWE49_03130 [Synergistaceae bacterium]|nr:hypothetical protein [Synergistaceae bacterium]
MAASPRTFAFTNVILALAAISNTLNARSDEFTPIVLPISPSLSKYLL